MARKKGDKTNPFLSGLYNIKSRRSRSIYAIKGMAVSSDGEIMNDCFTGRVNEKHVETSDFIKIFPPAWKEFKTLSARGKMILFYLLSELDYKDYVSFNISKAKEFTGYTSDTGIYLGISELKKRGIIASHYRNGYYWINPTYFYKGNRTKLI